MKSELQVQLEIALFGKLKSLCHQLKGANVPLGSTLMKAYLALSRDAWIDGTKYMMTELAAQAEGIAYEEVKALANED